MTEIRPVKVGLLGIGLSEYWGQFEGLKGRLDGYLKEVERKISETDVVVISGGLVDNVDQAFITGDHFRNEGVQIIFLYAATYALSSTVLPVVQRAKVPVIILNLTPDKAIDYRAFNAIGDRTKMTGEWLAHCGSCSVPELTNVFKRTGISFFQITGHLYNDHHCWDQIKEWIAAAHVAHRMSYNRMGCMGHYYSGMLDIYSDLTLQYAAFGGHIELLEVDELAALREQVTKQEIDLRVKLFQATFEITPDCELGELERAAKTSVALDQLVDKYQLGSLAYYYKGSGNFQNEDTMSSIILGTSMLTTRGIPVAGEYEIKNAQAMKILEGFGAGGSFTEYYALDFEGNIVLMGHDGPGHTAIAEGKTKVKPLEVYHGKVGKGLSVEMSVRNGPVTLLSVVEDRTDGLFFLVAEGESVSGPILEIGNTNSRYRFPIQVREFADNWNAFGPAHHCAVGLGHIRSKIEKLGLLLGIPVKVVC